MEPGCNQHHDSIDRNPALQHCLDHRPQEEPIGNGPGDVADQDTGAAAPLRQIAQGTRRDRSVERPTHRRESVGKFRQSRLANDRWHSPSGKMNRQNAPSIGELESVRIHAALLPQLSNRDAFAWSALADPSLLRVIASPGFWKTRGCREAKWEPRFRWKGARFALANARLRTRPARKRAPRSSAVPRRCSRAPQRRPRRWE